MKRSNQILLAVCGLAASALIGCESAGSSRTAWDTSSTNPGTTGSTTSSTTTSSSTGGTTGQSSVQVAGQTTVQTTVQASGQKSTKSSSKASATQPASQRVGNTMIETMAFPTGNRATSAVLVERTMPIEIPVNKPFSYDIRITNLTEMTLRDVSISDECASNFEMNASEPAVSTASATAPLWTLGDLAPRAVKVIKVTGTASATGSFTSCAKVTYNGQFCLTSSVVQPNLQVTLAAPAEAILCEQIPLKITVTNTGTGTITNAKVNAALPEELKTTDGRSVVELAAGTIPAGQTRDFTVPVRAAKVGSFVASVKAGADNDLTASSQPSTIVVRQPALAIVAKGSQSSYVGRDITYEFTVRNNGDTTSRNTVVAAPLPANTSFVRASDAGASNASAVSWQLASIEPGESRTITMTVRPFGLGAYRTNATVTGSCSLNAAAEFQTAVIGIPDILLEVADIAGPLEVGATETFTISVSNQGSAEDKNVQIVIELPEEAQYVTSTGPSAGTVSGRTLTFSPLSSLAPKGKAEWRVMVKATKAGDARLRATMTSDNRKRPIEQSVASVYYE
jgi:uncharacterized repeat protein (TIGR01451 family)